MYSLKQTIMHAGQSHYSVVPTLNEAVGAYEASGGFLSPATLFGHDPLVGHEGLQSERQSLMEENLPTPENIFSCVVNGIDTPLVQALQFMIQKSFQLQSQI